MDGRLRAILMYLLIVKDIVFIRIGIIVVQHGQRFLRAHGIALRLIVFVDTKHIVCVCVCVRAFSDEYAIQLFLRIVFCFCFFLV